MKNITITGGYGFIGGHLLQKLIEMPEVERIRVIDNRTEGYNEANERLHGASDKFATYFATGFCDTIFHLAAASHVDSVNAQPAFALSNVEVMYDTLELARTHGARLIVLSTDEVYGETEPGLPARTCDALVPSSPYSASKAACDMLALGWARTYGMNISILRAGNNYGPGQHESKFVPKLVNCIKHGEEFPMYGDGEYYRSWQPVEYTVACLIEAAKNERLCGIRHATSCAQYQSNKQIIERLRAAGVDVKTKSVPDRAAHDRSYYCWPTFTSIEPEIVPKQKNIIDFILSQL